MVRQISRVAHADLGYAGVEVKGGRISISEGAREWTSTDGMGISLK